MKSDIRLGQIREKGGFLSVNSLKMESNIPEIIRAFDEENIIRMIVLVGDNDTSKIIEITNESDEDDEGDYDDDDDEEIEEVLDSPENEQE